MTDNRAHPERWSDEETLTSDVQAWVLDRAGIEALKQRLLDSMDEDDQ